MDDEELSDYQNPDNWIEEVDSIHEPDRNPRAIVSVEFASEDFTKVAKAARGAGMKTAEFIRMVALARAT